MTIIYKDLRRDLRFDVPNQQIELVRAMALQFMLIQADFNLVFIDLRSDSVEVVELWRIESVQPPQGQRVSSMGGASAWGLYSELAKSFPQIDNH